MWPFLLLLAIVPLIFYWSDSVRELFPQLASYLPDKLQATPALPAAGNTNLSTHDALSLGPVNQWIISNTPEGYVAWTLSADGQYRLAVGCRPGAPASLQITHVYARSIPENLVLNYQYGRLGLTSGVYTGAELISGVAQLSDVYVQTVPGEVLAQYRLPGYISGSVAREVETTCEKP